MAAQKSEIGTLRSQLAEATVVATTATATAQSSLQTILAEEREKAAADRQNLISQITTLINNTGFAQDKRLTERVESVKADIGATQIRLEAASKDHEVTIESWSAREELFYTRLCDVKETVQSVLADDWKVSCVCGEVKSFLR